MFDSITQTVKTKDLAEALRALPGMMLTESQLAKRKIVDRAEKVSFICPGMITRIAPCKLFNPTRDGSEVFYITGERFSVELSTEELAKQIGIGDE